MVRWQDQSPGKRSVAEKPAEVVKNDLRFMIFKVPDDLNFNLTRVRYNYTGKYNCLVSTKFIFNDGFLSLKL
jgi:hypothetical protein